MTILANRSKEKNIIDTVFSVVAEAKKAKEQYGADNVVDATIGSLYTAEGQFAILSSVSKAYSKLDPVDIFAYAPSFIGSSAYHDAVKKWVVQEENINLLEGIYSQVISTPGGSGAVSSTIHNFLDSGETVLVPNIGWGPYKIMAKEFGVLVETYEMFTKTGEFNIQDFIEKSQKIAKKQKRVLAIINDPCQNPTGYSMTRQEWEKLGEEINTVSKQAPFILLNDIAYIDYDPRGLTESRNFVKVIPSLSENCLLICAFSCSKSLTSYGLRVGAQVAFSKSKAFIDAFKSATEFSCRGNWSNVNRGGMALFTVIMSTPKLYQEVLQDREDFVQLLNKRNTLFLSEAAACGLETYPFSGGFFITLKLAADKIAIAHNALKENLIFTIVVDGGLRVATCSIPASQIEGLAQKMQKIISKVVDN